MLVYSMQLLFSLIEQFFPTGYNCDHIQNIFIDLDEIRLSKE